MRALWISLVVLGATAVAQAVVVVLSGSVALLGDTVHNAADALTAVPLGHRLRAGPPRGDAPLHLRLRPGGGPRGHRDRADDRRVRRLRGLDGGRPAARTPGRSHHIPVVAVAAVIGFLGNEWVARHRIRVGREIGSAALVADGLHARTDGFTSLAVLVGAGGAALGWQLADPLVGLAITAAILLVLRDAAREVFRRVMDAVDPAHGRPGRARRCARCRACAGWVSCGCAGSGTGCAPRWRSWSTARRACARPTTSPSRPSTPCCTPSRDSPRPWSTPIRHPRRARRTPTCALAHHTASLHGTPSGDARAPPAPPRWAAPRTPCPARAACRAGARCRPARTAGRRPPSPPTPASRRGVRSGVMPPYSMPVSPVASVHRGERRLAGAELAAHGAVDVDAGGRRGRRTRRAWSRRRACPRRPRSWRTGRAVPCRSARRRWRCRPTRARCRRRRSGRRGRCRASGVRRRRPGG